MRACFGLKAHCGWSALVLLGRLEGDFAVLDRRRIELVEPDAATWARQPYHAAESLEPGAARELVERGVEAARRIAIEQMRAAVQRCLESGHEVAACAVLVSEPMPGWSVDEILAVHFRMHKAEGHLFPEAMVQAARACALSVIVIREKRLGERAEKTLAAAIGRLQGRVAALGKSVGPPWGKDQKNAALAAMIALQECSQ